MSRSASDDVPVTIAIMAGGASRRMRRDKATMVINGMTMLERVATEALMTPCPVVVVGRPQPDGWSLSNVEFLVDDTPGIGPLGGLVTALRSIESSILAVACDMPLLGADAIRWLIGVARSESGEHGVTVTTGGEVEPLFTIYHRSCFAIAERRLAAGQLSMKGLIAEGEFNEVEAPEWVATQLRNVNRPEDLTDVIRP